jgi:hypothetical protein
MCKLILEVSLLNRKRYCYRLLQAAYEELNRKYTMLQRGERDLEEQIKEIVPVSKAAPNKCRPCLAKSSKSVTYIKMPEVSLCIFELDFCLLK